MQQYNVVHTYENKILKVLTVTIGMNDDYVNDHDNNDTNTTDISWNDDDHGEYFHYVSHCIQYTKLQLLWTVHVMLAAPGQISTQWLPESHVEWLAGRGRGTDQSCR